MLEVKNVEVKNEKLKKNTASKRAFRGENAHVDRAAAA